MPKQIVVLMEGSGNAFDSSPSNVTRVLDLIHLSSRSGDAQHQMALYDQGVGTRPVAVRDACKIADDIRQRAGCNVSDLVVLDPPRRPRWMPGILPRLAGLAFGLGLERNVAEVVTAMYRTYKDGDKLFMLGFSRGAFTVRVIAALLHRFGLPPADSDDIHSWVSSKMVLMRRDPVIARDGVTPLSVEVLGLWDTVKSYGVLRPRRFFHLRHNAGVQHVSHALALDEKRSWFQCTTWGGLDIDAEQRDGRTPDHPRYPKPEHNPKQTVREMWFRGCHSDIGGGKDERENAEVALRWMLSEAKEAGLVLNARGEIFLQQPDPTFPIQPHESRTWEWCLADIIPRAEIDNDYSPARLNFRCWPTGQRDPQGAKRGGKYERHPTA